MTIEDDLPTTLTDPILRLAEYWLSAKLMHEHAHTMRDDFGGLDGIIDAGYTLEFQTYLAYWLSALYVVAEGFLELNIRDQVLEDEIPKHIGSLRLYRNATFHFQKKSEKHSQFHDGGAVRLNWAENLHEMFELFFRAHLSDLESKSLLGISDRSKPMRRSAEAG